MLLGSSVRMSRLICVIPNDGSTVINTKGHVLSQLVLSRLSRQLPDIFSGCFVFSLWIFLFLCLFLFSFLRVCTQTSPVSWHLPYRAPFSQQHSYFSVISSPLSCLLFVEAQPSPQPSHVKQFMIKTGERSSFWTATRAQNSLCSAKVGGIFLHWWIVHAGFTKCSGCWTVKTSCAKKPCSSGKTGCHGLLSSYQFKHSPKTLGLSWFTPMNLVSLLNLKTIQSDTRTINHIAHTYEQYSLATLAL